MAFRFRKSFKIAPGVRINLSKSGVSTTVGGKGASVNFGKNGTYLNTGIPGTGLYSREKISGGFGSSESRQDSGFEQVDNAPSKSPAGNHILLGIVTALLLWFVKEVPGLTLIVGVFMITRFVSHIARKSKPVYGEQPVYKSDRRFKSGQRLEGYQKVKVGSEPLTEQEIKQHKTTAYIRLAYAVVLLAPTFWVLMSK